MNLILSAAAIGVGIGLVVGALGAGGGILSVPVLVSILGMAPHDATGASLVVVGLTAIVAIRHPAKHGNVRWKAGSIFGAIAIVGAALASRLSLLVPERTLMLSFGVLLLVVAVVMARRARLMRVAERAREGGPTLAGQASEPEPQPSRLALILAASATGLLTGFFGVGGGFLAVPMLVIALGLPMRAAAGTSLLVMIMTSSAALLARIGTPTHIDWPSVLIFAAGTVLGGAIGGPLSSHARPSTLTAIFAALLAGVGALTLATT